MPKQGYLMNVAPCGSLTRYDQNHLALYAALLDAEAAGEPWQRVASTLMRLDPEDEGAERCWHSHLVRARWITGSGLIEAVEAFGTSDNRQQS